MFAVNALRGLADQRPCMIYLLMPRGAQEEYEIETVDHWCVLCSEHDLRARCPEDCHNSGRRREFGAEVFRFVDDWELGHLLEERIDRHWNEDAYGAADG